MSRTAITNALNRKQATVISETMAATKDSDIRILLVGRTGHGKSSTANSILGRDKFKVSDSAVSVTPTTEWSDIINRFEKSIEVVDTPGIFDTHRPEEEIHKELIKSLLYTTPGFHAIVFVLEKGRFTDELVRTKDLFFSWFGSGVEKFACIILTHTEDERAVDKYLSEIPEGLKDLIERCGGRRRIAPIDNKAGQKKKEKQVERVLKMIEEIKQSNGNEHFSNVAFQLATQYAYNKCSGQISTQSIHILRQTGLEMQLSETECRMLDMIFQIKKDTASHAERERPRTTRLDRKVDTSTFRANYGPQKPEEMSVRAQGKNYGGNGNTPDMTSGSRSAREKQSIDHPHDNTINYASNVDLSNADVDPLYTLKDDVSKGKTNEKGLFNYLRDLWIRGKNLKCTIL